MDCPLCRAPMADVTETWHTMPEAVGAEYLTTYVSIWRCERCGAVAGADQGVEWVMEPEEVLVEE